MYLNLPSGGDRKINKARVSKTVSDHVLYMAQEAAGLPHGGLTKKQRDNDCKEQRYKEPKFEATTIQGVKEKFLIFLNGGYLYG